MSESPEEAEAIAMVEEILDNTKAMIDMAALVHGEDPMAQSRQTFAHAAIDTVGPIIVTQALTVFLRVMDEEIRQAEAAEEGQTDG